MLNADVFDFKGKQRVALDLTSAELNIVKSLLWAYRSGSTLVRAPRVELLTQLVERRVDERRDALRAERRVSSRWPSRTWLERDRVA